METTASAAKQVSPPPALIAEYEVLFGTAAAVAIMPTFEDELDDEDVAIQGADAAGETLAAPRRSGWITALARRIRTSRNERPPRRHYPTHLDREFIADARMDREMYRL